MKYLFFLILTIGGFTEVHSQSSIVKGKVLEYGKQDPIPYANILLLSVQDSAQLYGTISEIDGEFELANVREGTYLFKIQYLGYKDFFSTLEVKSDVDLGSLSLQEQATDLGEVVVVSTRSTRNKICDTHLYNAEAFKTRKAASAQVLIEKLPGVFSEGGARQALGVSTAQILMDRKPFLRTEVQAAL